MIRHNGTFAWRDLGKHRTDWRRYCSAGWTLLGLLLQFALGLFLLYVIMYGLGFI